MAERKYRVIVVDDRTGKGEVLAGPPAGPAWNHRQAATILSKQTPSRRPYIRFLLEPVSIRRERVKFIDPRYGRRSNRIEGLVESYVGDLIVFPETEHSGLGVDIPGRGTFDLRAFEVAKARAKQFLAEGSRQPAIYSVSAGRWLGYISSRGRYVPVGYNPYARSQR